MIDVTPFYNPFKVVEKTADGFNVVECVKNGVVYKIKQPKTEKVQSV